MHKFTRVALSTAAACFLMAACGATRGELAQCAVATAPAHNPNPPPMYQPAQLAK